MQIPPHLLNDCVEHDNKVLSTHGINEGDTRGDCVMNTAAPQRGFHTLFKNRNFLLLWLAQLTSMTILNASNYAIIVLIEEITGSTTLIALAIISFSIPAVIIGAPAGVFVDHRNKRRVLFYRISYEQLPLSAS